MRSYTYVRGSNVSYADYLQGKDMLEDAKANTNTQVAYIRKDLREMVASTQGLMAQQISVHEMEGDLLHSYLENLKDRQEYQVEVLEGKVKQGFEILSYEIRDLRKNISSGLNDLGAKFDWCCGKLMASLGGMNDSLQELVELVKNPLRTKALERFDNARRAFDNGWYPEALTEVEQAIHGVPGISEGYSLEWRFYQLLGTLRLGFTGGDYSLMDLSEAENAFSLAGRYAEQDSPQDAAHAYLSAGWAAYCQGNLEQAISHTEKCIKLYPKLAEAWFQLAKLKISKDDLAALEDMDACLQIDSTYALKALTDANFLNHEREVAVHLKKATKKMYAQLDDAFKSRISLSTRLKGISGLENVLKKIYGKKELIEYNRVNETLWRFYEYLEIDYYKNYKELSEEVTKYGTLNRNIENLVKNHEYVKLGSIKEYQEFCTLLLDGKDVVTKKQYFENEFKQHYFSRIRSSYSAYLNKVNGKVDKHYKGLVRDLESEIIPLEKKLQEKLNKAIGKLHPVNAMKLIWELKWDEWSERKLREEPEYYSTKLDEYAKERSDSELNESSMQTYAGCGGSLTIVAISVICYFLPGASTLAANYLFGGFMVALLIWFVLTSVVAGVILLPIEIKYSRLTKPIKELETLLSPLLKEKERIEREWKALSSKIFIQWL